MKRKIETYFEIILLDNGQQKSVFVKNEKEKTKFLYNHFTTIERVWATNEYQNSPFKSFKQWFKAFTAQDWKGSHFQVLHLNKKTIIIIEKEKN